ncbi:MULTISPECIES: glycosyltransferase family 4 protein [unclassified Streptomyces]|uniref:glycosyltransferase family 4 protein n=1 Tax=unclassified Streptomyces TaxID=2593676 RepID=UPI0003A43EF8|nr:MULTISPECIES: glycosyltransferase family 4 protein [unclassified Streptomyces]MYT33100.1 glycosyltransferase [Streptomyces sp. SID8354]
MSQDDAWAEVGDWRGRHVVVCNWRDGRHPQAGGAELYCEETARELRTAGAQVTFLTARPRGTARRERTDYGTVVRGGSRFTVYLFVLLWLLRHRRSVDGVIDSQNGIPFFTPLVLPRRTPVVLLIHHVHQGQFALWFPPPLAALGRWLENRGSALVYGRRAICAVSPSTRTEIRGRLALRGPVHFAPAGLAPTPGSPGTVSAGAPSPPRQRAAAPRIVCVGRLVRQKCVDRLVRAMFALRRDVPDTELHIVGDGDAYDGLRALVDELGLDKTVVLHGRVPTEDRDALVESAWITASASCAEGWGLSVMEAAATGIPAVAFDVPGLRDTIRHGVTGWLLEPEADLAAGLAKALQAVESPSEAARWDADCRAWAARFTWTATVGHLLAALTAEEHRLRRGPRTDRRTVTDTCTLVSAPAALLRRAELGALRTTDLVDTTSPDPGLLLLGADERDAERILRRIGLDPHDPRISIRLARHGDILGWPAHPPPHRPQPQHPRATDQPPARTAPRTAPAWPPFSLFAPFTLCALFVLALALRLTFIQRSYDVFVDEVYYTVISHNLADGHGPTFDGKFFALHPPAVFALLAAVMRITGLGSADLLHLVLQLRSVLAIVGSLAVVAVTMLLRRAVRWPIALAAGLFLALDPFLNRFDSRVLLEAPAVAAAALGWLALARRPATFRGRIATGAVAGLLFATAVTSKEPYALETFVPVTVLVWIGHRSARSMRLTAAVVTLAGYAVYLVSTVAVGAWPAWWAQKTDGIARALGLKQISGFNSNDGSVSFTARLIAQLGQFAVPYTLIALGTAATAWLLWLRLRRPLRLAGPPGRTPLLAWAVCTLLHLAYAIAVGTLEEQMFYPLVVTSTATLALAADLARPRRPFASRLSPRRRRSTPARALTALAAVALTVDALVWVRVHTRHDDAFRRTLAWVRTHLPRDSVLAAQEETADFLLPGTRLDAWQTPADLVRVHADYVVLSTELQTQGYGRLGRRLAGQLERHARLLHREPGRTAGELRVYDVGRLVAEARRGSGTGRGGGPGLDHGNGTGTGAER